MSTRRVVARVWRRSKRDEVDRGLRYLFARVMGAMRWAAGFFFFFFLTRRPVWVSSFYCSAAEQKLARVWGRRSRWEVSDNVPPACCLCQCAPETHFHMFIECDFSYSVLSALLPVLDSFLFRPNIMQTFVFLENLDKFNVLEKHFCFHLVCCTIYHLWRGRNNRRFFNVGVDLDSIITAIKHAIRFKLRRWKF
ncbi:hypothetical protein M5K25_005442 [Dendrobium thyrsiflorum]|uniref:Reverse transcriptase zinc-binding domain-containing protein n=1 Tax=Dendrobium thyrsiflorum TaxID=117978 RepID=A0ABD0VHM9_DENTH